jgi:hypothetical protein
VSWRESRRHRPEYIADWRNERTIEATIRLDGCSLLEVCGRKSTPKAWNQTAVVRFPQFYVRSISAFGD